MCACVYAVATLGKMYRVSLTHHEPGFGLGMDTHVACDGVQVAGDTGSAPVSAFLGSKSCLAWNTLQLAAMLLTACRVVWAMLLKSFQLVNFCDVCMCEQKHGQIGPVCTTVDLQP